MKTIVIAALAALLSTTAAHADYQSRTTCGRTYLGKYECTSTFTHRNVTSGPLELRTSEEIEKFNVEWENYCKPQRGAPDRYGVVRVTYAHPGCEFGATGSFR